MKDPKCSDIPIVSIGVPVYNGEKFIRKRLDTVLSQTLQNFDLIISDNASTDSTSVICMEYVKKDKRIRYLRQEENMGLHWNFEFLLREAKCKYFVWAAADDYWSPNFLEKNINTLELNENLVGSIGQVEYYGDIGKDLYKREKQLLKKIGISLTTPSIHLSSTSGLYEERIRNFLKHIQWLLYYAVFRTEKLQRVKVDESFPGQDGVIILGVLRYGDIYVHDDVLMHYYRGGTTSKGLYYNVRQFSRRGILGVIFPLYPFTRWCLKELGIRIFLKNIDILIRFNLRGEFTLLNSLYKYFKEYVGAKT